MLKRLVSYIADDVIGYFVVAAEPAVHVLTKQVYELTSGAIPKKALRFSLMIGVSVSVGLAMLRILCHLPIMYFLIPGYLIALVLTFIVPEMFTAIAFDSGGVASGAMTASFLMPRFSCPHLHRRIQQNGVCYFVI